MKKYLIISFLISFTVFAQEPLGKQLEDKIFQLQEIGLLEKNDAKKKAYRLKLIQESELKSIKAQARSVAKALVNKTIIRIDNEDLEITIP